MSLYPPNHHCLLGSAAMVPAHLQHLRCVNTTFVSLQSDNIEFACSGIGSSLIITDAAANIFWFYFPLLDFLLLIPRVI
jgi:hypothetical protein